MKTTSSIQKKATSPKNEDDQDDLIQKMKTTSSKNEDDLSQKMKASSQKIKTNSL